MPPDPQEKNFELGDKVEIKYAFFEQGTGTFAIVTRFTREKTCEAHLLDGGSIETGICNFAFVERCSDEELLTHSVKEVRDLVGRR